MKRPGFTVIEVVAALALSVIVVGSAYGVLTMLARADSSMRSASAEATDLMVAQATLREAFSSMIAATPIAEEPESDAGGETAEGDPLGGIPDDMREQVESILGLQGSGADAGLDERLAAAVATADTSVPPHFDLYFEEIDGVTLPRLEMVLAASPARFSGRAVTPRLGRDGRRNRIAERARLTAEWSGMMRGVFELVSLERRGWALVWQPIAPAGPRVVLIDGLVGMQWRVLTPVPEGADAGDIDPSDAWQPVHAAYLQQDFPDAVELRLETESGTSVEWRFEAVTRTIRAGVTR